MFETIEKINYYSYEQYKGLYIVRKIMLCKIHLILLEIKGIVHFEINFEIN